jgi:Sigma-70, region 4
MNAFRGLSRGIVPELESAWLFKIAHNVCLSRRRSSWRRGKIEAPNNLEVLQEVIPGREQISDELIGLQDVLETMPENQRRAILLREWQGLTYREISAELGLSQAAVETLIFRARRALAQGLEQDADTWKKRLRRGADVGGAIAFVKALLGGGGAAAVKIAATAVAVAATTVAAATEVPKHAQHAAAIKPTPAVTQHVTPQSTATIASPAAISIAHVTSTRSLPKPVALPASHPKPTAVASATTEPSSAPETQPTPAPSRPDPALPPAPSATSDPAAPAANGNGNGKGNRDERTIQATTQTIETPAVPPTVDPPAQQSDQGQGNDNKVKPDKPGNGNGNADANNGNGNGKNK